MEKLALAGVCVLLIGSVSCENTPPEAIVFLEEGTRPEFRPIWDEARDRPVYGDFLVGSLVKRDHGAAQVRLDHKALLDSFSPGIRALCEGAIRERQAARQKEWERGLGIPNLR
jgi:hypothetical protein